MSEKEIMELLHENWSNDACLGYLIKSCKYVGMNKNHIKTMVRHMEMAFDIITVDEAKKIYKKYLRDI